MITKLKHHDNCEVLVVKNNPDPKKPHKPFARMICLDCAVLVQHIGRAQYYELKKLGFAK